MEWWAKLKYRRLLARMAGPKLLDAFAQSFPQAFFVEIGANDGEQHDHLRPLILSRRWSGVMVEPVRRRGVRCGVGGGVHGGAPGVAGGVPS